jgi:cyanophycinase-like exopeptidase
MIRESVLPAPLQTLSEFLTERTCDPQAVGGQSAGALFTRQSMPADGDTVEFWLDEWSRRSTFDLMMLQLADAA